MTKTADKHNLKVAEVRHPVTGEVDLPGTLRFLLSGLLASANYSVNGQKATTSSLKVLCNKHQLRRQSHLGLLLKQLGLAESRKIKLPEYKAPRAIWILAPESEWDEKLSEAKVEASLLELRKHIDVHAQRSAEKRAAEKAALEAAAEAERAAAEEGLETEASAPGGVATESDAREVGEAETADVSQSSQTEPSLTDLEDEALEALALADAQADELQKLRTQVAELLEERETLKAKAREKDVEIDRLRHHNEHLLNVAKRPDFGAAYAKKLQEVRKRSCV